MEEDQVQLGLHWGGRSWRGPSRVEASSGPRQKGPRRNQVLGARDEAGPGTVGAALGPRMEETQAQLGLLWGPGWWEARHSQSLVAALSLYSSTLIHNLKW